MRAQRARVPRGNQKDKALHGFTVISGRSQSKLPPSASTASLVTQDELSDIILLQARIGDDKNKLKRAWKIVRDKLTSGAAIESGPGHAWLSSVMHKPRSNPKSIKIRTRLVVR